MDIYLYKHKQLSTGEVIVDEHVFIETKIISTVIPKDNSSSPVFGEYSSKDYSSDYSPYNFEFKNARIDISPKTFKNQYYEYTE